MRLTLPVPPSANRYWRFFRGRVVPSKEAQAYKQGVKLRALTEGFRKPPGCPVAVSVVFYRARKAGDLDNRLKCVLDALQGIAYLDDSQVTEIHARRMDDASNPRIEVTVEEAE